MGSFFGIPLPTDYYVSLRRTYNYTLINSMEKFLVEDNIIERNPFNNEYVVISLFKEYQKWKLLNDN